MSCKLPAIKSISRCAPFFVMLANWPSPAFSQSYECHPIRSGETATQLARRITGDAENRYQPWFQIMNRSSRFVPKSQYDRIRPGWRVCIAAKPIESRSLPVARHEASTIAAAPVAASRPTTAGTPRPTGGVDLTIVWLGAALLLPLFGWRILDDYIGRRKAVLIVMQHFAHRFVNEFERPLIQQPADHPVRARLRLSPAKSRLEILLAPGQGRRYPNLSDHKKNVEYDVVRILRALADNSFVSDPLYTQAGWVVVPFRFKAVQKHAGAICLSFF